MNRNNKALCVMLALAVALQLALFTLVAYWLGTIAGLVNFEPVIHFQRHANQFADVGLVFNDEYPFHGGQVQGR